jgi:hypothetical protein
MMTTDDGGGARPDGEPEHGESKTTPPSQSRRTPGGQGTDVLSDFQRWLVRAGARSMRSQISGQVRRTLSGGKTDSADVWDTATTEPPVPEGEAPECQWCPICRAARRMRESRPGIGEHLLSASEAVAAAMQEGLRTLDDRLSRPSGSGTPSASERASSAPDAATWISARDQWAAEHGATGPSAKARSAEQASPAQSAEGADGAVDTDGVSPTGGIAGAHSGAAADNGAEAGSGAEPDGAATAAQDLTSEPDGPDEPDDRS